VTWAFLSPHPLQLASVLCASNPPGETYRAGRSSKSMPHAVGQSVTSQSVFTLCPDVIESRYNATKIALFLQRRKKFYMKLTDLYANEEEKIAFVFY
jgi:hypothetical protein